MVSNRKKGCQWTHCLVSKLLCTFYQSVSQKQFLAAIFYYICRPQNLTVMKKGIHPEAYRTVIFKDFSCDYAFMGKSAANTKDKITWEDGNEYPLVKLEISNMSHPFYTGKMQFVDTAGRIEKFNKKYGKFAKK